MLAKMKIPAIILQAFKQQYPNATIEEAEEWSDEEQFALNFWDKGIYKQAIFELDGEWTETNYDIERAALPEVILEYIEAFYQDYSMELILQVESEDETNYIVGLAYGEKYLEVTFDEEGTILESNKEHLDDDDDDEYEEEDEDDDEDNSSLNGYLNDSDDSYNYNRAYTSDDTMRPKRNKSGNDSDYHYNDWN